MTGTDSNQDVQVGAVLDRTKMYAAGLDRARAIMTAPDAFLKNQSRFDRQARMRLPDNVQLVTEHDYFTFLRTQIRPWSAQEVQGLAAIFNSIQRKLVFIRQQLPEAIYLIKTSGQEEGFSAYTRHDNTIVMSETKVALMGGGVGGDALHPQGDVGALENIYLHECFHLLSKNNPETRHRLYAEVGYRQLSPPLTLPPGARWADGNMADMKITNPDTPELNVVIDLVPPDEPAGGRRPMMPVLLARAPYVSGVFFNDLEWVFLRLEQEGGASRFALDGAGQPIVHRATDKRIMRQYMEKVGFNITEEIFHPDEVLAQNFVLVINEPSLGILQGISRVLHSTGGSEDGD